MKRVEIGERQDWRVEAERLGFGCHTIGGERYWDERHAYCLSENEIRAALEGPTNELMEMCYRAVGEIVKDSALLERMQIDPDYHGAIRASWNENEKDIYSRFDFSYDGSAPAKLLEVNGDCAGGLFEAAVMQGAWLEAARSLETVPPASIQFNLLDEALAGTFMMLSDNGSDFRFAADSADQEQMLAVGYLIERARAAGLRSSFIDIGDIGIDDENWFTDLEDIRMRNLFMFMQLAEIVESDYGPVFANSRTRLFEPLWKIALSNKGVLPVLWDMYPGHPNLLPAFFEDDKRSLSLEHACVFKPLDGWQGEGVEICNGAKKAAYSGEFGGRIVQGLATIPRFGADYAMVSTFVVAGRASGLGVFEDDTEITGPSSRFVPHYVSDS
jgi:glutathionylspermidine synthase